MQEMGLVWKRLRRSMTSWQARPEQVDVLLDDRLDAGMGWKMTDSFYVGYPVVVILGKALEKGMVEVRDVQAA